MSRFDGSQSVTRHGVSRERSRGGVPAAAIEVDGLGWRLEAEGSGLDARRGRACRLGCLASA